MVQLIQILKLLLSLLPLIIDAIKVIEAAVPAGGNGAAKLAAVRELVQGGFAVVSEAGVTFEQAWPAIEKTVGALVGLFNKTGSFQK